MTNNALENTVIRWYVKFAAQQAEKAFTAKKLITAIDQAYPERDNAPRLVKESRNELLDEMTRTAFSLQPELKSLDKLNLGVFKHTAHDLETVNNLVKRNLHRARERAYTIDATRFVHLIEAKSLVAGAQEPAPSVSVNTLSTREEQQIASEASVDTLSELPNAPESTISRGEPEIKNTHINEQEIIANEAMAQSDDLESRRNTDIINEDASFISEWDYV